MINRVVIIGRLTKDLEPKQTQSGISNLRFTVAVNRKVAKEGQAQADFINCVAWRQTADNMAKFLRKGSLIGVEGRIETGSYQAQDGTMRYTTDVIAESVQFLEPKQTASRTPDSPSMGDVGADAYGYDGQSTDFNSTIKISDDDLPF